MPTLTELKVDVQTSGWTAMVAPKDTPADIIARVQRELAKALQNSDLKLKLDDMSAEPVVNTPEAFGHEWREEAAMWERAIKKAGIKVE